jgi:hypothetical protein
VSIKYIQNKKYICLYWAFFSHYRTFVTQFNKYTDFCERTASKVVSNQRRTLTEKRTEAILITAYSKRSHRPRQVSDTAA